MFDSLKDITNLMNKHEEYRNNCLNLIASENYINPVINKYLASDLGGRYGCYENMSPEQREYTGNKYIHQIEMKTQELVKETFNAEYCDLRPIGGHIAGVATVMGMTEPNDLIMEIVLDNWGHGLIDPMADSVEQFGRVFNAEPIPYNSDQTIDLERFKKEIKEKEPKLIILGSSGMLFPEPVEEIVAAAKEVDAYVIHDSSHVSGLIAGGVFPNPLEQGVDAVFCSTHKSFPGPQGGMILSNSKELMSQIAEVIPSLVTSHHINRLPALAAAMLENQKYGKEYGEQIIKNTKALAEALHQAGFNVLAEEKGFTNSHLLLVDVKEFGGSYDTARILEKANILTSDDFGGPDREIRVGTAEVTRRGMKEENMKKIAEFFKKVLIDKEDNEKVVQEIENYTSSFNKCSYCLEK